MDPRQMALIAHAAFEAAAWTEPTVDELEARIAEFIAEVPRDEEHSYIESGRIRVQRDVHDDNDISYGVFLRLN